MLDEKVMEIQLHSQFSTSEMLVVEFSRAGLKEMHYNDTSALQKVLCREFGMKQSWLFAS